MLSWRIGSAWGLFLENEDGFVQRVYLGDAADSDAAMDLSTKICIACRPVSCVLAFMTERDTREGHKPKDLYKACFLEMKRDGSIGLDVYRRDADTERGNVLGDYLGHSDDEKLCEGYSPKLREALLTPPSVATSICAQKELVSATQAGSAWCFLRPSETF